MVCAGGKLRRVALEANRIELNALGPRQAG